MQNYRWSEFKVLFYRLGLAYLFAFIARFLFWIYNYDLLKVESMSDFFKIALFGLTFDTASIIYANVLFVVLSILPLWINTRKSYQSILFYAYIIPNLLAFSLNFVDFIYYKFTYSRTTISVVNVLKDESDLGSMFFRFFYSYWHVSLLFIVCSVLWIFLYKRVKIARVNYHNIPAYSVASVLALLFFPACIIGGVRGDLKKSTRPMNIVDASRHVKMHEHADLVLNTPFTLLRTVGKNSFKEPNYRNLDSNLVHEIFQPIKQYEPDSSLNRPNIVVIITESMGREYLGAFNKENDIENHKSYTPFLDSLAAHSLIFPNAYANGYKSIHGMSSVLAGIPSFKDAFTSSPYSNQKIQSLISNLEDLEYNTSFFHGAPNGSMGFLGFSNILGIDEYVGKTEYNNDADFDGVWGIWDEPFLQFMAERLSSKQEPFFSSVFTVTSHEPYQIPFAYEGKFPKGDVPMHKAVGYTDYAFKQFFESAKNEPWFNNTIFIITSDHCNQTFYKEYRKSLNRNAVPILIYAPNGAIKGIDNSLAQQIDIYPTIMDLAGYDKPFRSWGRSLLGTDSVQPFCMNYGNNMYRLQRGNYICVFDGNKAVGFYAISDKALKNNLIENRTSEMDSLEWACKAYLKDYFHRIINKKL